MLIFLKKERDHRNRPEGIFEYDRYIILNLRKTVEGKHLILAGCGHAHLNTLMNIRHLANKGHRVSVIGSSPYHYYSGMGPGMLGSNSRPQEIKFNIQKAALERGASFILDRVTEIDADGRKLEADIALFALGIRPSPILTWSGLPTDSKGALLVTAAL